MAVNSDWKCKFPGCTRLTDEDLCAVCERAVAAARRATDVVIARMAFALAKCAKAPMASIDRDLATEAGAALAAYEKETKR